MNSELKLAIKQLALSAGYVACGITSAEPFAPYERALRDRRARFPAAAPLYDAMRHRVDPRSTAPWVRSIVVCVRRYGQYALPPGLAKHIGRNYLCDRRFPGCVDHGISDVVRDGLKALGLRVRKGGVPDRWAAVRAGVARFANNCFVYAGRYGSWINIESWRVDAEIDPEIKSQLPMDMESRLNLDRIEKVFKGTDMLMVVFVADDVLATGTLKRLRTISRKIERPGMIDRAISLFTLKDIRSDGGEMFVDPAVKRIPGDDRQREELREKLEANDMVYGNVVSTDFKATAIIALKKLDAKDEDTLQAIQGLVEEVEGPEQVVLGGLPFIRKHLSHDIRNDIRRFLPVGILVMLIFLFICFGRLRGVLLPFLVVVMAIIFGMGLIPLFGWKIQMLMVILPVILIAVANDYGIHLIAAYQEYNTPDTSLDRRALAKKVLATLFRPIMATGITTIAGIMCLLAHIIVPAQRLGILASLAILFALAGSLVLLPAILSILPRDKPIIVTGGSRNDRRLLERLLAWTSGTVARRPAGIVVATVLITAGLATGIVWLEVDTNPSNYYPPGSEVRVSGDLVNRHFGGATPVSVMARGDIKDPKVMEKIDRLGRELEAHSKVGQTSSIARAVRKMNLIMQDGDPAQDRIPDSREAIAQYFLFYSMSGDPEDFDRLVDFPYEHAVITARMNSCSSDDIQDVVDFVRDYVKKVPDSPFEVVGGFAPLFAELVDAVVTGQILSLLLSLVIIGMLVALLFRSLVAGVLSMIPLGLAMGLLFGLMGYLGIELNMVTAMLSSIMIGVGIDYTIHFLWRYREERRAGKEPVESVFITLTTTGRGIVFNALSVVVGFAVMLISTFLPVRFFGFLVVVSIGTCLVGALVVLPALCLLIKPRFLEPPDKTQHCR